MDDINRGITTGNITTSTSVPQDNSFTHATRIYETTNTVPLLVCEGVIEDFEPDPKWEMTTLEKASFDIVQLENAFVDEHTNLMQPNDEDEIREVVSTEDADSTSHIPCTTNNSHDIVREHSSKRRYKDSQRPTKNKHITESGEEKLLSDMLKNDLNEQNEISEPLSLAPADSVHKHSNKEMIDESEKIQENIEECTTHTLKQIDQIQPETSSSEKNPANIFNFVPVPKLLEKSIPSIQLQPSLSRPYNESRHILNPEEIDITDSYIANTNTDVVFEVVAQTDDAIEINSELNLIETTPVEPVIVGTTLKDHDMDASSFQETDSQQVNLEIDINDSESIGEEPMKIEIQLDLDNSKDTKKPCDISTNNVEVIPKKDSVKNDDQLISDLVQLAQSISTPKSKLDQLSDLACQSICEEKKTRIDVKEVQDTSTKEPSHTPSIIPEFNRPSTRKRELLQSKPEHESEPTRKSRRVSKNLKPPEEQVSKSNEKKDSDESESISFTSSNLKNVSKVKAEKEKKFTLKVKPHRKSAPLLMPSTTKSKTSSTPLKVALPPVNYPKTTIKVKESKVDKLDETFGSCIKAYKCLYCNFSTDRMNNIVYHMNTMCTKRC